MKLIYENDIPEWPIRNETEKFVTRWNHERTGRWKPNGITNNIEEWEKKHKELLKIDPEYKAKRCLDVIDIYSDIAHKTKVLVQNLNP